MVTAETALVLPLVAAFTLAMAYLVSLGVGQVRIVDAARDAARSVAAGETSRDATRRALDGAPPGSSVEIEADDDLVRVTVRTVVEAPSWLLVPLPAVTLTADASVQAEAGHG